MFQRASVLNALRAFNTTNVTNVVHYMLETGGAETPPAFLDFDQLGEVCQSGTEEQVVSDKVREVDPPSESYPNLVECMGDVTAMGLKEPVGCVIDFDNGNRLAVVGAETSFYMIDLLNALFVHTNGPEYDIGAYVNRYGSDSYRIRFFRQANGETPASPAKKKAKTTKRVKKEVKP